MKDRILFSAEHIIAGYGKKEIIHDISFSLETHTLTALVGANGCGKTTLLRSIAGQLKHQGNCYLGKSLMETLPVKEFARKVSYIPQKSGFTISLPVIEIVLMGWNPVLKLLENPSKRQRKMAIKALEKVGLAGYENIDFLTLSEGQKQLVFMARTMIEDTQLLLLDEPESALDFQNRYHILTKIKEMVEQENRAGLLSLHDPALALEFCQQLLLIKDGRCVDILYPQSDSLEVMEGALRKIYGNVSLTECAGRNGKRHIILIWEGM